MFIGDKKKKQPTDIYNNVKKTGKFMQYYINT